MTDMTPGSRWLLPVEIFDVVGFPGEAVHNARVQTIGDDYFKLYDEDVATLIPADRITELEGEVERLKYALYMTIDPFAAGTEQAMELLGDYQPTEEHNKCP